MTTMDQEQIGRVTVFRRHRLFTLIHMGLPPLREFIKYVSEIRKN